MGKKVLFGQNMLFSCKSGCIRANVVDYSGMSDCIPAKCLYSGKKWLYSGKRGCIPAKWMYSVKNCCIWEKGVLFGQSICFRAKEVVLGYICLYSGMSGCIRAKWF